MNFRPTKLQDVIGQKKIKRALQICIDSHKKTGDSIPHLIFQGPPGLGKSTFGSIIANEISKSIQLINAATVTDQSSLIKALVQSKRGDVVFIDEIHALPTKCIEMLYGPLEDFVLTIETGNKFNKKIAQIPLENITVIGATTNIGLLPKPLLDRFKLKFFLDYYEEEDIAKLIKINAYKINLSIDDVCSFNIAKRCKGIPRISNNLIQWLKAYCSASNIRALNNAEINKAFEIYGISEEGFDKNDKIYLDILERASGPLGLKAISTMSGIPEELIENSIEPYLLKIGKIEKTPKGRILKNRTEDSILENLLKNL